MMIFEKLGTPFVVSLVRMLDFPFSDVKIMGLP